MAGNKNVSILEKSVKIIGEICSDGVFDTSGTFNGTIVANVLTVKDGGHIEGKIFANELNIAQGGTVNGEIVANREQAEVFCNCYVDGHPVILEGWDRLL